MNNSIRYQVTLFLKNSEILEKIREKYNPVQYALIKAHITVCREDELQNLDDVIKNLSEIKSENLFKLNVDKTKRFSKNKGVLVSFENNMNFEKLRKKILNVDFLEKEQIPHLTLMHPRNSICTDEIFEEIKKVNFPDFIEFKSISLIRQIGSEKWELIFEKNFI